MWLVLWAFCTADQLLNQSDQRELRCKPSSWVGDQVRSKFWFSSWDIANW